VTLPQMLGGANASVMVLGLTLRAASVTLAKLQ
jgi:hypothetical protein